MGKNITYYLGAGASAYSIPVVTDFYEKAILPFGKLFEGKNGSNFVAGKTDPEWTERNNFIQLCKDYSTILKAHPTVDTFAKKLFIKGNNESLVALKIYLILLFTYLQLINKIDARYDKFIASIIKSGDGIIPNLPENIKIITWNYDLHFELQLYEYLNTEISSVLNYINSPNQDFSKNAFQLARLNGIASGIDEQGKILSFFNKQINREGDNVPHILEIIFEIYRILSDDKSKNKPINECFTYCWENSNYAQSNFEKAIKIAKMTDILVVIGYSFPFVNRDFDISIINAMSKLYKVYIQNPDVNDSMIDYLKERFEAFDSAADVVSLNEINEFYLPNEL